MRVLLAFDGSASARTAMALVRSLAWPAGTAIRVVQVQPQLPVIADVPATITRLDANADAALAAAVTELRREGLTVESEVVRGDPPADVLVREAAAWKAELIVTGHRGHGALATAFLGSVARDVAEKAHCAVLVARRPSCGGLVFAEDGSEEAFQARRALASWPIFRGKTVRVVSVAHVLQPLLTGVTATVRADARAARDETEMEARVAYTRLATAAADDLRVAGLHATLDVRSGDPAEEIASAARDAEADLIVMGTRGRGAIARVLLGSVARAVLISAPCSVLVVRSA